MSEPIRILFVGELQSSHAQSWIDLLSPLSDEFKIHGLHTSSAAPPISYFPISEVKYLNYLQRYLFTILDKAMNYFGWKSNTWDVENIHGYGHYNSCQLANIHKVIHKFKPHVIHTFGIFPASVFLLRSLPFSDVGCSPKWIVQARGGPDIALNRKNPVLAKEIKAILNHCDYFIADNHQNYSYALEMGLEPEKLSVTGPVPGTGGIDSSLFNGVPLPSQKERLILWPKAYNCIQSDGLVVVEALRLALPRIGKFRLVATAATPDIEYWFNDFLSGYGPQVEIHSRLPREELLEIYRSARVLLAPSLSDGVPNSMYEAMASHTVPILSPLDTLLPLFENNIHTIYAPNLNAQAIADALVSAMNDDALADRIATTNRERMLSLAERSVVRDRVVGMYRNIIAAHHL